MDGLLKMDGLIKTIEALEFQKQHCLELSRILDKRIAELKEQNSKIAGARQKVKTSPVFLQGVGVMNPPRGLLRYENLKQ